MLWVMQDVVAANDGGLMVLAPIGFSNLARPSLHRFLPTVLALGPLRPGSIG